MGDIFKPGFRIALAAAAFVFASQAQQAAAQFNQTAAFTITDPAHATASSPGCPKSQPSYTSYLSPLRLIRSPLPDSDYFCFTKEEDVRGIAAYYAPYAVQAALSYYQITNDATLASQIEAVFPNQSDQVNGVLARKGWQFRYPDRCLTLIKECAKEYKIDPAGLAYHVWSRADRSGTCREATIAFRGSIWSIASWGSNFEQQLPGFDSEYKQVQRDFNSVLQAISDKLHCRHLVTLGHSLGGGLAQFVALGLSPTRQISKVVTFNTSPVSGVNLVSDERLLNDNMAGLTIDRVNQQGEILSLPFFVKRRQTRASLCDPLVRGVEFNETSGGWQIPVLTSLDEHSIVPLASKLVKLAYNGDDPKTAKLVTPKLPPAGRQACSPRYKDEQEDGIAVARFGEPARYASADLGLTGVQPNEGGRITVGPVVRGSLAKLDRTNARRRVAAQHLRRGGRLRSAHS